MNILPRKLTPVHRQTLKAQVRLLARAWTLQAEAHAFLSRGQPLRGYARLRAALPVAAGLEGQEPMRSFLAALLSPWGLPLRGYVREVAHTHLLLALETGLPRGYHPNTSEVLLHLPQGVLALAAGAPGRPCRPSSPGSAVGQGMDPPG